MGSRAVTPSSGAVPSHRTQILAHIWGSAEQWKLLAEEAAQEEVPEKLMKIIEALTRAIDERHGKGPVKEQDVTV